MSNKITRREIVFKDNSTFDLKAIYSCPDFEQHCKIPKMLGFEITEQRHIKTELFQKATVKDVFACGDNAHPIRS